MFAVELIQSVLLIISAILMIIAIMFDSVDGWVARKINRNDALKFGQNIHAKNY